MAAECFVWEGADLGAMLKRRRVALGFKQSDVSKDLGYSQRLISEIENGRESVAYGKILRYAGYLGVDLILRERG